MLVRIRYGLMGATALIGASVFMLAPSAADTDICKLPASALTAEQLRAIADYGCPADERMTAARGAAPAAAATAVAPAPPGPTTFAAPGDPSRTTAGTLGGGLTADVTTKTGTKSPGVAADVDVGASIGLAGQKKSKAKKGTLALNAATQLETRANRKLHLDVTTSTSGGAGAGGVGVGAGATASAGASGVGAGATGSVGGTVGGLSGSIGASLGVSID